jgi:hypothetical protein
MNILKNMSERSGHNLGQVFPGAIRKLTAAITSAHLVASSANQDKLPRAVSETQTKKIPAILINGVVHDQILVFTPQFRIPRF